MVVTPASQSALPDIYTQTWGYAMSKREYMDESGKVQAPVLYTTNMLYF